MFRSAQGYLQMAKSRLHANFSLNVRSIHIFLFLEFFRRILEEGNDVLENVEPTVELVALRWDSWYPRSHLGEVGSREIRFASELALVLLCQVSFQRDGIRGRYRTSPQGVVDQHHWPVFWIVVVPFPPGKLSTVADDNQRPVRVSAYWNENVFFGEQVHLLCPSFHIFVVDDLCDSSSESVLFQSRERVRNCSWIGPRVWGDLPLAT
mmetsp:Transcript_16606/g.68085  ORF Transcript_16606/g.68085 Transcript_16606/m.68085 type:complete len:208 (-) Transcript_16606:781-1404(-)